MDAIYLLSKSKESIRQAIKDFTRSKKDDCLYNAAHLLVLGPVDDGLMTEIHQAPKFVERIKTFKEINLDFLVAESQVHI